MGEALFRFVTAGLALRDSRGPLIESLIFAFKASLPRLGRPQALLLPEAVLPRLPGR
jgi:hypothetical protein